MTYLPYCGWWFYGASSASSRASFMCSWGLLETAPIAGAIVGMIFMSRVFYSIFR